MKPTLALPCLLFAAATAVAQETNEAPTSSGGLQIVDRTEEERIEFLFNVASAYYEEKEYGAAIDAYERILKIDPDNQQARYIIAHVYINGKLYEKAERLLQELIDENPEDFKLLNNLAWLYATADDPAVRDGQKAVNLAQEAMVMAPNDHHVWSTLAEAHYVVGEYERAYKAITTMANLASKYGQNITKEMVEGYNEQIRKCKRAMDLQKELEGDEEGGAGPDAEASDGDPANP